MLVGALIDSGGGGAVLILMGALAVIGSLAFGLSRTFREASY